MRKLPVSWQKILFLKVKLTFTKTTYFLIKKRYLERPSFMYFKYLLD
jgi:hypothetical protein